jgi:deoxyribodipyrimidine photo-lyase
MGIGLVWFRQDLRLHDNLVLKEALKYHDAIIPLYIFERKYWRNDQFGHQRTGPFRTAFLVDAVADLRKSLQAADSELIIKYGKAEEIIGDLAAEYEVEAVYSSKEVATREVNTEARVHGQLRVPYRKIWHATLFHPDDVPFNVEETPDVYTNFRKKCEKYGTIQEPEPAPSTIPTPSIDHPGKLPTLEELGSYSFDKDERAVLQFEGGETPALERLDHYFWGTHNLARYKQTRNGLIGPDYSSKFSAWLNLGCLSPRFIYKQVQDFEHEVTKNKSTYWLIFELIWRDFFRFLTVRYGAKLFYLTGLWDVEKTWYDHPEHFEAWKKGMTGVPFIDANMREIYHTGYMSNRGRQNVASFLAKDLQIDWRKGASWFESLLVDYDVHSNWGNWNYNSGVGSDPREDRQFNVVLQAKKYDKQADYMRLWLPELAHLSAEDILNWPLLGKAEMQDKAPDYQEPIFINQKWYYASKS